MPHASSHSCLVRVALPLKRTPVSRVNEAMHNASLDTGDRRAVSHLLFRRESRGELKIVGGLCRKMPCPKNLATHAARCIVAQPNDMKRDRVFKVSKSAWHPMPYHSRHQPRWHGAKHEVCVQLRTGPSATTVLVALHEGALERRIVTPPPTDSSAS